MNTKVDVVHTAHVPTVLNSRILDYVSGAGRKQGVRFVQTVTALPAAGQLHRGLFWADAITCLNPSNTETVSRYHDNVRTIVPVPSPDRLANRVMMPEEFVRKLGSDTVICMPVQVSRLPSSFSLAELCATLLRRFDNLHIVFACRVGEERCLWRSIDALARQYGRISVLGEVEWILELFRRSRIVVYPIGSLDKKFNPPLVVLEAICVGAAVVVSDKVDLSVVPEESCIQKVDGESSSSWFDAILSAMNSPQTSNTLCADFEQSYQQYRNLYLELLEG